jgi:exodeoxyribonuclease-3
MGVRKRPSRPSSYSGVAPRDGEPTSTAAGGLRILSWNVNGVRAILRKGFDDFVRSYRPDVLCLQEIRARPDQVDLDLPGYAMHWNPADKPGYSGTAVFSREAPVNVMRGFVGDGSDTEGRVATVEFDDLYVASVYSPNSKRDLSRLQDRIEWEVGLRRHFARLDRDKPVVFCGDLNVAHTEIDLARPKDNKKNHGFTPEERGAFGELLDAGFVDTFRAQHPEQPGHYTWWRQFGGARERNVGWRIDYVCASTRLQPRVGRAFILRDVRGSDHCPVGIDLA